MVAYTKKTKATINFTDKEITVEALSKLASYKILVWIIDPLGDTVYKNANWDTNSDADFDLQYSTSTSITKDLPLDTDDDILEGVYTIYYKNITTYELGWKDWEWTSFIKYCPVIPTVSIKLDYSCRTSEITSEDTSDYILRLFCGATIEPITPEETLYSHVLYYPQTIEGTIPDPVTSDDPAEIITVTPIYTKRWVSKITRYVIYEIPESLNDIVKSNDIMYSIEGTLLGQSYIDVACSDCICSILSCINQVYNSYKIAVEKDSVRARELQVQLDMLYLLLFRYLLSEECGSDVDTASICAEIKSYLDYTGLICCTDTSTTGYSVEVVPYGSGGSSTLTITGTQWYSGATNPSVGLGNNGDYYLQTVTHEIWKKILGVWNSIMTVEFTGEVGNAIIDADFTEVSSNLKSLELLKAYTIPITEFNSQTDVVLELTAEVVAVGTEDNENNYVRLKETYLSPLSPNSSATTTTNILLDTNIGNNADIHLTIIRRLYVQYITNEHKTNEYVTVYATTTVKSQTGVVLHEFVSPNRSIYEDILMEIYSFANDTDNITLKASTIEIKRKGE